MAGLSDRDNDRTWGLERADGGACRPTLRRQFLFMLLFKESNVTHYFVCLKNSRKEVNIDRTFPQLTFFSLKIPSLRLIPADVVRSFPLCGLCGSPVFFAEGLLDCLFFF